MTAVPVTRTFVAGETVLASYFNTNINGPLGFLLAPPILEITHSTTQSVANNTFTALLYDTEVVDSSGMHSTSSNTSRATAVYPGWYVFGGGNAWAANSTGRRGARGEVNAAVLDGTETLLAATSASGVDIPYRGGKLVFLNATDYFEWFGFQESGGNLNAGAAGAEKNNMSGHWISN